MDERRKTFWSKVIFRDDGCMIFQGEPDRRGGFRLGGRTTEAHRVAWVLEYGPIPKGAWVLHKCDVAGCVNPEHLYLGTPKDNAGDRTKRYVRPGPKRSKPTSIRMWPSDDAWVREQAKLRRVPVNLIIDEAIQLFREKVDAEISSAAVFEAVKKASAQ